MTLFPFDSQWLEIELGMHSHDDRHCCFFYRGCEVDREITLDEWHIHSTFAEAATVEGLARIGFGVLVQRISRYYVVNVMTILFCISSLTFSLFVVDVTAFFDRAKVYMTILVTQVILKLSIGNMKKIVVGRTKGSQPPRFSKYGTVLGDWGGGKATPSSTLRAQPPKKHP